MKKGIIKIYPNREHYIAIPAVGEKINEYFVEKIKSICSINNLNIEQLLNGSFTWYNQKKGGYMSFTPNITHINSEHNFLLATEDDTINVVIFKTKDFSALIQKNKLEVEWEI